MSNIRGIDKKIDKIWYDIVILLTKHRDDFICSSETPTNEDRKEFIKRVREKSEIYSRIYNFTNFINRTNFYQKLYSVSIDMENMMKIRYFYWSIKMGLYDTVSLESNENLFKFWYGSSNASLKELCLYLYDEFINRKDIKKYYFNLDESKTIQGILIDNSNQEGGRCPYCDGKMVNGDPDHFLPKSRFPLLAMYSKNIILSCKNCNMGLKTDEVVLPLIYPNEINVIDYVKFKYLNKKIILEAISNPRWQKPVNNYLSVIKIIKLYDNEEYYNRFKQYQKKYFSSGFSFKKMEDFDRISNLENKWERKIREDFFSQLRDSEKYLEKYSEFMDS
ncbi:HNH endonuclease signature motif containing protein [uncultured Gemella sp.]|uniref:HNH endonuclease n=1 Tax=uncultured Gemella sp. TaxID=254352 RepID=UPI0028D3A39B|nr:HNH endonuclease signature motif containing protein [uncultured Gemella sp.]